MKTITLTVAIVLMTFEVNAQEISDKNIAPFLLDREALSGLGLEKIDLKDEPEKDFYQRRLYWGADLGIFVVSTENWTNTISDYPFDEFIYMYHGEALVKPSIGASQIFYSGDYFFAPKGFVGKWEIKATNDLHYELSIITTSRADSTAIITNARHKLFNKAKLSGNSIHLNAQGFYEEILEQGAELTIKLNGEKPVEKALSKVQKEKLVHLLSGQIKIIDSDGNEHQYFTGDFFVLRKGLSGSWTSKGHGLVKYLTVEKTDTNKESKK